MDGTALGEKVKQDPQTRNTSLILMSSFSQRGGAPGVEKVGFSGYLPKPLKRWQLEEVLRKILTLPAGVFLKEHPPILPAAPVGALPPREERILLVEDTAINQKVAVKMLKKLGYRADVAPNGREALKALESARYDLILMDVQMPEMDGLEATLHIREKERVSKGGRIPIIAMTAHALKGDRQKCLEAGMDGYLTKPIQQKDLAEMLAQWAQKPKVSVPPEDPLPGEGVRAIFDHRALRQQIDDNRELLGELLATFLEDTPQRIQSLEEAISRRDVPAIRYQGHALKGTSGTMRASALQQISSQMEQAGERGDLARAREILEAIRRHFADFQGVAAREISTPGASSS
jgi:CheY-like chemotaxis protein/HPt (histidine-containing phosphotransfer) domain-containing protein